MMFSRGSNGFSTSSASAVLGINCISPIAPTRESARWIERRLRLNDRSNQRGVDLVEFGGLADDGVVGMLWLDGDEAVHRSGHLRRRYHSRYRYPVMRQEERHRGEQQTSQLRTTAIPPSTLGRLLEGRRVDRVTAIAWGAAAPIRDA